MRVGQYAICDGSSFHPCWHESKTFHGHVATVVTAFPAEAYPLSSFCISTQHAMKRLPPYPHGFSQASLFTSSFPHPSHLSSSLPNHQNLAKSSKYPFFEHLCYHSHCHHPNCIYLVPRYLRSLLRETISSTLAPWISWLHPSSRCLGNSTRP